MWFWLVIVMIRIMVGDGNGIGGGEFRRRSNKGPTRLASGKG